MYVGFVQLVLSIYEYTAIPAYINAVTPNKYPRDVCALWNNRIEKIVKTA